MIKAAIKGIGWVTAEGFGTAKQDDHFQVTAGKVPKLQRKDFFDEPDQRFGRLDAYSKMGVAAFTLAMRDAGLNGLNAQCRLAAVVSTSNGSLTADHEYYQTVIPQDGLLASPNLFAYTLPNCMLGEVSIRHNITGPCIVVEPLDSTMLTGIIQGLNMLSYGMCDMVIAGYCDAGRECVTPGSPGKPMAAFMVMHLADKIGNLCYNGDKLTINGIEQPDIATLVKSTIASKYI